jgi:hypothetical protein
MSKKYWTFKNQANNEADLYLYLEIASWGGGFKRSINFKKENLLNVLSSKIKMSLS